jgi:hypothetical protein
LTDAYVVFAHISDFAAGRSASIFRAVGGTWHDALV